MVDSEDDLERLLSARMAKLGTQKGAEKQSHSFADQVLQRIEEDTPAQIDLELSSVREWVLFSAALLGAVIVMFTLAGLDTSLLDSASTIAASLRETVATTLETSSFETLASPYAWLLLLIPAGLLVTAD